jgi:methylglutaconyl-CoA hydratase
MNTGTLRTHVQDKIATVVFSHPAANSLPSHLLLQLTNEFEQLSLRSDVQAIVLKSEGASAFCAGASFEELSAVVTEAEAVRFFRGFAHVLNAMRACTKAIIGSIHGKTVGGGVGLAAACDLCYATSSAAIKLSELTIGIGPFVIEPAVKRKIGKAAFSSLSLDATRWHTAEWACEKGLYARVFSTKESMEAAIASLARTFAAYAPEALVQLKKIHWEGTEDWPSLLPRPCGYKRKIIAFSSFQKSSVRP